jgi:hypothetical protein
MDSACKGTTRSIGEKQSIHRKDANKGKMIKSLAFVAAVGCCCAVSCYVLATVSASTAEHRQRRSLWRSPSSPMERFLLACRQGLDSTGGEPITPAKYAEFLNGYCQSSPFRGAACTDEGFSFKTLPLDIQLQFVYPTCPGDEVAKLKCLQYVLEQRSDSVVYGGYADGLCVRTFPFMRSTNLLTDELHADSVYFGTQVRPEKHAEDQFFSQSTNETETQTSETGTYSLKAQEENNVTLKVQDDYLGVKLNLTESLPKNVSLAQDHITKADKEYFGVRISEPTDTVLSSEQIPSRTYTGVKLWPEQLGTDTASIGVVLTPEQVANSSSTSAGTQGPGAGNVFTETGTGGSGASSGPAVMSHISSKQKDKGKKAKKTSSPSQQPVTTSSPTRIDSFPIEFSNSPRPQATTSDVPTRSPLPKKNVHNSLPPLVQPASSPNSGETPVLPSAMPSKKPNSDMIDNVEPTTQPSRNPNEDFASGNFTVVSESSSSGLIVPIIAGSASAGIVMALLLYVGIGSKKRRIEGKEVPADPALSDDASITSDLSKSIRGDSYTTSPRKKPKKYCCQWDWNKSKAVLSLENSGNYRKGGKSNKSNSWFSDAVVSIKDLTLQKKSEWASCRRNIDDLSQYPILLEAGLAAQGSPRDTVSLCDSDHAIWSLDRDQISNSTLAQLRTVGGLQYPDISKSEQRQIDPLVKKQERKAWRSSLENPFVAMSKKDGYFVEESAFESNSLINEFEDESDWEATQGAKRNLSNVFGLRKATKEYENTNAVKPIHGLTTVKIDEEDGQVEINARNREELYQNISMAEGTSSPTIDRHPWKSRSEGKSFSTIFGEPNYAGSEATVATKSKGEVILSSGCDYEDGVNATIHSVNAEDDASMGSFLSPDTIRQFKEVDKRLSDGFKQFKEVDQRITAEFDKLEACTIDEESGGEMNDTSENNAASSIHLIDEQEEVESDHAESAPNLEVFSLTPEDTYSYPERNLGDAYQSSSSSPSPSPLPSISLVEGGAATTINDVQEEESSYPQQQQQPSGDAIGETSESDEEENHPKSTNDPLVWYQQNTPISTSEDDFVARPPSSLLISANNNDEEEINEDDSSDEKQVQESVDRETKRPVQSRSHKVSSRLRRSKGDVPQVPVAESTPTKKSRLLGGMRIGRR